ncbi:MAG: M14 family metallopeptidase [Chloroherpetonaceae bacterium]|nr:M14 family metallopeptidase [Chloroherpetonaceae bacterium]
MSKKLLRVLTLMLFFTERILAQEMEPPPFYPNASYDPAIPTPDAVLGYPLGSQATRHSDIVRYFQTLAEKSPLVRIETFGETFEKRKMIYAVISSQENLARLTAIRSDIEKLASGKLSTTEANALSEKLPAIVWLAYTVHGNELSGSDAALQVAYHLAAGKDAATEKLRQALVVIIEPVENPDGRERAIQQFVQWSGSVPNPDAQSLNHTGGFPSGRFNHYLFDMNRDWLALVTPESQARVKAIQAWRPQLIVDAHEMGSDQTYYFNPPSEPINPNISNITKKWWKIFSDEQAKAFDQYGWSYYTREIFDEWYAGYGSSYALYIGAVGILYEQASTQGSLVRRPDGSLLTYREAVHHHFVSSLANLTTAANNRTELLRDFFALRKEGAMRGANDPAAFFIVPTAQITRVERMLEKLLMHKIEVEIAEQEFSINAVDYWSGKATVRNFPKGTLIVRLNQPNGRLAKVMMEFDPRMPLSFLQEERYELEKNGESKIYDVTGWSMPIAYGLECYWSRTLPNVPAKPAAMPTSPQGKLENPDARYGFLLDATDERAMWALSRLLAKDCKVYAARKPFEIAGRSYPRGALLLRKNENPPSLLQTLTEIAKETGVTFYGVSTARASKGPDLGGNEFVLLYAPKIGILVGDGVEPTSFAPIWHLLDARLRQRVSLLNPNALSRYDLQRYNVLIMPSGNYQYSIGTKGAKALERWVEQGGTLIAIEDAAAFLADSAQSLTSVRLRSQALKALQSYEAALQLEESIGKKLDSLEIWEPQRRETPKPSKEEKPEKKDDEALQREDERIRLFMPRGALLTVKLNEEHWLAFGAGEKVAATIATPHIYLSKPPVETVGRFADAENLRVSGLLWPEARAGWAKTGYLMREAKGRGQVILFAGEPNFRAYFHATERLLLNAIYYGVGFGTRQSVEW